MSLSESDNARYLRGKRDAVNEMLLVIGVEPRTSISQSHTVSSIMNMAYGRGYTDGVIKEEQDQFKEEQDQFKEKPTVLLNQVNSLLESPKYTFSYEQLIKLIAQVRR